jgi:hypothetical protein
VPAHLKRSDEGWLFLPGCRGRDPARRGRGDLCRRPAGSLARRHGAGPLSRAAEVSENRGALGWEISAADMAEIDAILARHRCLTAAGRLED